MGYGNIWKGENGVAYLDGTFWVVDVTGMVDLCIE